MSRVSEGSAAGVGRAQRRAGWVVAACAVIGIIIGCWPMRTRSGVNYAWSSRQMPLHEKMVNFLSRDLQLRRLAKEITAGASTDEQEILNLFSWVTKHLRPAPERFPVIDDHVLHVIIRGYGADDQRTEAFAVLAGYAGLRASIVRLEPPGSPGHFLFVALVSRGERTYVFDVVNHVIFQDDLGHLADATQLMTAPRLIEAAAPGQAIHGIPYRDYFLGFDDSKAFSRTEAQRLWPRVRQELARFLRVHREKT